MGPVSKPSLVQGHYGRGDALLFPRDLLTSRVPRTIRHPQGEAHAGTAPSVGGRGVG